MKTTAVTSKTNMKLPARFTMKELQAANPDVKYPTLNARVIQLIKKGELLEVGSVKTDKGRGRAALVYATPDASLDPKDKNDPLYQAKKQGRYTPVAAVEAPTVDVPVEVVAEVPTVTTDV